MANIIDELKNININMTTFTKVDHRIEALRLAVSLHDRIPIGEKTEAIDLDRLSESVIKVSERFLDHLRNNGGRHA